MAKKGEEPQDVSDVFARWASALKANGMSADATHHAKRCLVDWYGCTVAGSQFPAARKVRGIVLKSSGSAWLVPDRTPVSELVAALINGTSAHAAEFDDIYAPGLFHPGAPIIAAAHAVADHVSGYNFLLAVAAGYEVANRIARAVNPAHYENWHTTGTVGVFGAAVAAGLLRDLTHDQLATAIRTAATMAAGLRQGFGGDTKPLHSGRAAESGLLAALLAKQDFTAPEAMLEGEAGFARATSRDVDWDDAVSGFDGPLTIEQTTFKVHGCCGHGFAALDAIQALRTRHEIDPGNIDAIRVGTYQKALDVLSSKVVMSATEGQFSLPFCAATILLHGSIDLQSFSPERLRAADIHRLAGKVELYVDRECEARFPNNRGAVVQIIFTSGSSIEMAMPNRRGSPEEPVSDEELSSKFRDLAESVIGADAVDRKLQDLWSIDKQTSAAAVL